MSAAPRRCLCCAFEAISERVWHDIHDGERLKGGRSGLLSIPSEDTITDCIVLYLGRHWHGAVRAARFNARYEGSTTGADWELWFCAGAVPSLRGWGIRIQAKRVYDATFPQIRRKRGGHSTRQLRRLEGNALAAAPPLWPAYCFYGSSNAASVPREDGCRMASSRTVRSLIAQNRYRESDVHAASFPWRDLVCPYDGTLPLPEVVRNHTVDAIGRLEAKSEGRRKTIENELPEVGIVPDYVGALVFGEPRDHVPPSRSGWVVALIGGEGRR
jgi:hypothetical protein